MLNIKKNYVQSSSPAVIADIKGCFLKHCIMVVFDLILGTLFLVCNGMIIAVIIKDGFDWFSFIMCILGFLMGVGFFVNSIDIAKQNTAIEVLNGTLQYDTVSLDTQGKILEIKFK